MNIRRTKVFYPKNLGFFYPGRGNNIKKIFRKFLFIKKENKGVVSNFTNIASGGRDTYGWVQPFSQNTATV